MLEPPPEVESMSFARAALLIALALAGPLACERVLVVGDDDRREDASASGSPNADADATASAAPDAGALPDGAPLLAGGSADAPRRKCSDLTSLTACGPAQACDLVYPNEGPRDPALAPANPMPPYAACREIRQGGRHGDLCRTPHDCDAGLTCTAGSCRAYCVADAQCGPLGDGSKCVTTVGLMPPLHWKPERL